MASMCHGRAPRQLQEIDDDDDSESTMSFESDIDTQLHGVWMLSLTLNNPCKL